jgi:hypothetical protein
VIESYGFGRITVDGKKYRSDIVIYPERTVDGWWRAQGHGLCQEDISEILDYGPQLLIIGTGKFGMMKVGEPVRNIIRDRGIELIVSNTPEAVRRYNEASVRKKSVAALHLTC